MTNRGSRPRWLSVVGVAILMAGTQAAVQVTVQGPAAAGLPGAVARSAQSDFNTDPAKTITAFCPPGTRITGGGGRVTGIPDQVVLTRMEPRHTNNPGSQDRYIVTAIADETGTDADWAVTAFALCAATLPSHAIQIVGSRSDPGSPQNQREVATCPDGKVALGSGARINNGGGQVHITEMAMGGSSTGTHSTLVTAQEDHTGFGQDWSLDAYVICANLPTEDHVFLTAFAPGPPSADRRVATVTCPDGMTVTGGGATILEGFSGRIVMERIIPEFEVGGIPGDEVTAVAREDVINDSLWTMMVHASCVA